jgi:hypothetical protein
MRKRTPHPAQRLTTSSSKLRPHALVLATLAAAALVACGGGGGTSSSGDGATDTVLHVSGVAATGAALAGASVSAKCAVGTATGTTLPTGSYDLTITGGVLPCVLEASDGATTLHSLASGSGDSATANITPVTELVVAQLTGQDPAAYFSSTTAGSPALTSTITAGAVTTASQAVVQTLASAGLDTSSVTDPISGALAAGTGNGYDGVLDALATQLAAAGSSLSEVVATVASASPASVSTSATDSDGGTSALAANMLLKPAAGSCSSLRAGDYWSITSGDTGGAAIRKFHVGIDTTNNNSASVTFYTAADGNTLESSSLSLTATAPVNCRFSTSDGADVIVSPSGIIAGRTSTTQAFVAVPVQAHSFADIAGNWNMIAGDVAEAPEAGWTYGYATIAITGSGTSGTEQMTQGCWFGSNLSGSCTAIDNATKALQRPVTLLADGSFTNHSANDTTDGGPWEDRFFVYKNGKGDFFAISSNISTPNSSGDGSLGYASKVRTLSMPAVASVSSNWNLPFDWTSSLAPVAIDAVTHTISSVDTSAGSFVRQTGTYGSTATHPETILLNNPYNGFNFRDFASGVAVNGGGTTSVRQGYFLKTGSNGVTVVLQPFQATGSKAAKLVISVAHPAS